MTVSVRVVRRATPLAVELVTGVRPYPILWFPRSMVSGGHTLTAGDRDVTVQIEDWLFEEKMRQLREGNRCR